MGSQNHLAALPLELHAHIFSNLQPCDILQVRQTCQSLYFASSERTVWMDALHRICVENALFKPSFPVASMSLLELERASMGPHRWIVRSSSKERNSDGVLPHLVTWHLPMMGSGPWALRYPYLVPGGRYLFSVSSAWLVLWDLGSPYSSDREPHIVASTPVKVYGDYLVHSTPDGMGLRVFIPYQTDDDPEDMASFYIYEIYPERASPQLMQIAYLRVPGSHTKSFYSLSYDRLIFAYGNVLTVWDYKANMWARWGIGDGYNIKVVTTKSAVALIRTHGVFVWEIPPLLPESSLSMSTDPLVIPPVFELHYPEDHHYGIHQVPCDWYSDSLEPLYYDVVANQHAYYPLKISRFEVPPINSKISGSTLNLLKTFEVQSDCRFMGARICQDKIVSINDDPGTHFLETHVSDIHDQQIPFLLAPLCHHPVSSLSATFCPATGRVVYYDSMWPSPPSIIVLDF